MKQRDRGIALPIVLLFTALVMGLLMSSAAYSVIGATTRNSSETSSTIALFAAESLLARVDGKFKDAVSFTGSLTTADVNTYLTSRSVNSITLANGATATVVASNVTGSAPIVVTLKSTGLATNGATKVVLKDYQFSKIENDTAINSPGALNSRPYVDTNGQPIVTGIDGATSTGIAYDPIATKAITTTSAVTANNAAYTQTYTVSVADPRNTAAPTTRIDSPPAYVELGDPTNAATRKRFKVVSKTATNVTLLPVKTTTAATFTASFASGTSVGNIPIAITAPLGNTTYPITTQMTMPVTDPSWFSVSDRVYVSYVQSNGTVGQAKGKVTATSATNNTVTIDFSSAACTGCAAIPSGSTLSEGTPLRRDVIGIVGGNNVDPPNKPDQYTYSANDPRILNPYGTPTTTCPSGDLMFCATFNTDYNTFIKLNPPKTLGNLNNLSGLTVINGGSWNGTNGLCGSGVLVVIGDFSANSTPQCENSDETFSGFVYVTGNLTMNGNMSLIGGMSVQGTVTGTTTLSGTKNGDKITYSLMTINDSSRLCCDVAPLAKASTWRAQ